MRQENKDMLGWAIRNGKLNELSPKRQLNLFANACDGPDDMFELANKLFKAHAKDNGVIKFNPKDLKDIAIRTKNQIAAERKAERQERRIAEAEATGPVGQGVLLRAPKVASDMNNKLGFNVGAFVQNPEHPTNVPIGAVNPVNRNRTPQGVNIAPQEPKPEQLNVVQFTRPEGYDNMSVEQRLDIVKQFLQTPGVAPIPNDYPMMTDDQKVDWLRTVCQFIPHKHSMDPIQITCLHKMINDPLFIDSLKRRGAKINPLRMIEVEGAPYPKDNRYDFMFVVETNKENEVVLVKALSVPEHDNVTGSWTIKSGFDKFAYKNKNKNPFKNPKVQQATAAEMSMGTMRDLILEQTNQAQRDALTSDGITGYVTPGTPDIIID